MSLQRPEPIRGDIFHLEKIFNVNAVPAILIWNDTRKPVKAMKQNIKPQTKPLSLGDERHQQLIGAIQGLKVSQHTSQIQDALPRNRDWRY